MSAPGVALAWGASTDTGRRRAVNEDAFLAAPPLFLVADGMGGHDAGAEASRRAIAAFERLVGRPHVAVEDVQAAFAAAVAGVEAIATSGFSAGTTLTGVMLSEQVGAAYWLVLNIGDSRTYRFAEGDLQQVSLDHSAVQTLVDRGEIDPRDAERHPQRNVVTRAVGAGSSALPDYWLFPVMPGERFVLCSDGLSKELSAGEIARALREEGEPQAAATRLVREALLRGGHDNITVVVLDAVLDPAAGDGGGAAPDELDEQTRPRAADPEEARVVEL